MFLFIRAWFFGIVVAVVSFVVLNAVAQHIVLPVLRPALDEAHQGFVDLARDVRDGVNSMRNGDDAKAGASQAVGAVQSQPQAAGILDRLVGDFGGTITSRQDTPSGRFFYVSVPNPDAGMDDTTAVMTGARRGANVCVQVWQANDGRLDISTVHTLKCAVGARQG